MITPFLKSRLNFIPENNKAVKFSEHDSILRLLFSLKSKEEQISFTKSEEFNPFQISIPTDIEKKPKKREHFTNWTSLVQKTEKTIGIISPNNENYANFNQVYQQIYQIPIPVRLEKEIFKDCLLVLQGIPSKTFELSFITNEFRVNYFRLPNTSVKSVRELLIEISGYGSIFFHLKNLVSKFSSNGIIVKSFLSQLECYLIEYQKKIQKIPQIFFKINQNVKFYSLIQLSLYVKRFIQDLEFLHNIFIKKVNYSELKKQISQLSKLRTQEKMEIDTEEEEVDTEMKDSSELEKSFQSCSEKDNIFKNGKELLEFLYTLNILYFQNNLFLTLFKKSIQPYLNWVSEWIYYGKLANVSSEFLTSNGVGDYFIEVNSRLSEWKKNIDLLNLSENAEEFWKSGFKVKNSAVPNLILANDKNLGKKIFSIGQALNIIKLYKSYHPILNLVGKIGNLQVFYKRENIRKYKINYLNVSFLLNEIHKKYLKELTENSIVQMKKKEFKVRREVLEKEISDYENMMHNAKMEEVRLKRELLKERIEEIQENLKEKERILATNKKVELEKIELERNIRSKYEEMARNQIISDFNKLIQKSKKIKRIAEWKIERMVLTHKRNKVLLGNVEEFYGKFEFRTVQKDNEQEDSDVIMIEKDEIPESGDRKKKLIEKEIKMKVPKEKVVEKSKIKEEIKKDKDGDIVMKDVGDKETEKERKEIIIDEELEEEGEFDSSDEEDEVDDYEDFPKFENYLQSDFSKKEVILEENSVEASKMYLPINIIILENITKPILMHYNYINSVVKNIFLKELKLDEHFANLRYYFFCYGIDFIDIFIRQISREISEKKIDNENAFYESELNYIFKNCQKLIFRSEIDEFHDLFLIRWKKNFHFIELDSVEFWNCITLYYNIGFPLNLIINQSAIQKYQKIFIFLLKMKKTIISLNDMWKSFKKRTNVSPELIQTQIFVYTIKNFLVTIEFYFLMQVIDVSYKEFLNKIRESASTIEDLIVYHQNFLDNVILKCLLTERSKIIMKTIEEIFKLVIKMDLALKIENEKRMLEHLRNLKIEFESMKRFLIQILEKLKGNFDMRVMIDNLLTLIV